MTTTTETITITIRNKQVAKKLGCFYGPRLALLTSHEAIMLGYKLFRNPNQRYQYEYTVSEDGTVQRWYESFSNRADRCLGKVGTVKVA